MPNPVQHVMRDLGANFTPVKLNNRGDVIGAFSVTATNPTPKQAVILDDGEVYMLPTNFYPPFDISDNRIVVADTTAEKHYLLNLNDSSTVPAPGLDGDQILWDLVLDDTGTMIAGTTIYSLGPVFSVGFIYNMSTGEWTTINPTSDIPAPPQPTPDSLPTPLIYTYLNVHDFNALGHAVGMQGWSERNAPAGTGMQVPYFYDGTTVLPVGDYVSTAGAYRVTDNDHAPFDYFPAEPRPEYATIYNYKANTITPFPAGIIIDMNSQGQILWYDASMNPMLTTFDGTVPLASFFPAGWSNVSATRMSDSGIIIGQAQLDDVMHGYVLVHPPVKTVPLPGGENSPLPVDGIFARILVGIINDVGGIQVIGGRGGPLPPYGDLSALLQALPEKLQSELGAAIDRARPAYPASMRKFAARARHIVHHYVMREMRRHDARAAQASRNS